MLGRRLRQVRLARGLSLDALAAEMGGVVTKQALSKYELAKAIPSPSVLGRLATALGVKSAWLFGTPPADVHFIAYRKGSGLLKGERERIESKVAQALEERVRLQDLTAMLGKNGESTLPVQAHEAADFRQAEQAAIKLRESWRLGLDPIGNLVDTLEENRVHVIFVEAGHKFDGLSATAQREGNVVAAAVVTRAGVPGGRERLNLAHELGHLVLKVAPSFDEEDAAFRFGGAFLAPAETLVSEVGSRRRTISLDELLLLKRRYGMSIQALLRRLRDLDVITDGYYVDWCRHISRSGWRKQEPVELPREEPHWLAQNAWRAFAEELISGEELSQILGEDIAAGRPSLTAIERKALLRQSPDERRRRLAEQAEAMAKHYEQDSTWRELQGGDVIEW